MDKEKKFKKSVSENIRELVLSQGYEMTEEFMGLIEFSNINNILTFVFEWNQTYAFYCQLQFKDELIDYPLQIVINRLKGISDSSLPEFGGEYDDLVDQWTKSLSKEFTKLRISELTINSKVIQELKRERELNILGYNKNLEFNSIKKLADEAWSRKNFKLFVSIISEKVSDFPDSYSIKLSIAKKRI